MRVSVVIPAFNEEKLLPATLASVQAAAATFLSRGWTWECVVCDNNSTDGTAACARAAGATVVFEPVNQIGRARDAGARAASGEWLVFIDADSTPSSALFAAIADEITAGCALGGGSTVELEPGTLCTLCLWMLESLEPPYSLGGWFVCLGRGFRFP